ncbi:MAG: twin-arginine translocation signal domain-containing protein [Opitutae bacterium]|nr:twin-arginine translocation signal domain-containing protein [Opitutae bacterium]
MNPRRQFLKASTLLGAALFAGSGFAQLSPAAAATPPSANPKTPVRLPALGPELVRTFVVAAHGDLAKTQAMLAEEPHLLNATWDWGGGDFETALGGASHMGRRDIALFLLGQGARLDIFAATMLGYLNVVEAVLTVRPDALKCPGPHGIPLVVHAQKGGAEAATVLAYLQKLTARPA